MSAKCFGLRASGFGLRASGFGQITRLTQSRRERGVELAGCAGSVSVVSA